MKKNTNKLASVMTATLLAGALSITPVYAANNTFGIDEINWTSEDWASIAMTNDDTVDTGAVIRKEANADSDAAGYLYRGAAAKVVEKGEGLPVMSKMKSSHLEKKPAALQLITVSRVLSRTGMMSVSSHRVPEMLLYQVL